MSKKRLYTVLIVVFIILLTLLFTLLAINKGYLSNTGLLNFLNTKKSNPTDTSDTVITRESLFGKYVNATAPDDKLDYRGFTETDNFFMSKVYILGLESDCLPVDYAQLPDKNSKTDSIILKNEEIQKAVNITKETEGVTHVSGMTVIVNGGAECNFVFFIKDGLNLIAYQHRDGHYEVVNIK